MTWRIMALASASGALKRSAMGSATARPSEEGTAAPNEAVPPFVATGEAGWASRSRCASEAGKT